MIHVVWLSYRQNEGIIPRFYWDQGLLERLFDRRLWRPVGGHNYAHHIGFEWVPPDQGAVVVVPAQHHVDQVDRLNADLARLPWALTILAGDECSLFPWGRLVHRNMKLWVMTPRPHVHHPLCDPTAGGLDGRFIGEGFHVDTPDVLNALSPAAPRDLDWFFAGQVTHERRRRCVEALNYLPHLPSQLVETPGFTQGLDRHDYLRRLAAAKVAPCPSGPGTPDSFRAYEALEAGVLPLVDAVTSEGWHGYWSFMLGERPPFPVIDEWSDLDLVMSQALEDWPANANRAFAWWQQKKRTMSYDMEEDVTTLSGIRPAAVDPDDRITVLIPTSPMPSCPDTTIIETTVASIRAQPELANVEIIVMIDGVRDEQAHRAVDYAEYVRRLLLLTNRWPNVVPLLADGHLHQANMTRAALAMVRTPCVVFVEHDTPVEGVIPWGDMAHVIDSGAANVIRLHHEAQVLDVHQHLMLDTHAQHFDGLPLLRCAQWSQRPHLASTEFYRWMIDTYFGHEARTMIEDSMHGVLDQAFREHGVEGWRRFRVWMYAPPGDIRRTRHIDGRGDDPKYECYFAYDGDQPEGAPRATAERVD